MTRALTALGLLLLLVCPISTARGQDASPARIPVKIIAGKLVVGCDVSTRFRRIGVSLFVEIDDRCGLRLHANAARGIRAENRDGTRNPITLHLPDLEIDVPARERGPDARYEAFTRIYSTELGEVPVVGTIGIDLLAAYHVTLDLANGVLELAPPRAPAEDAGDPVEGKTTVSLTRHGRLVWLPVRLPDGRPSVFLLGTSRHDSLLQQALAEGRDRPAGDIGPVRLGDVDLARYVALRPERLPLSHPDGMAGILGLNFLRHFRAEIDLVNHVVRFQEAAPAEFPADDLAFFRARVIGTGDAFEAWLKEHPGARLAVEAATLCMRARIAEKADDEAVGRAIRLVRDTRPEDIRASVMLQLMDTLAGMDQVGHAIVAGQLGIECGRNDRYPDSVHKIHARLGRFHLERNEGREAWRHLLSAAFGLPEDGMINLDLGRYYEEEGRLRRAFSRFVQAVIKPESASKAIEGLRRVQAKLGGKRVSVDLVEKLIAGKIPSFGTATRYEPKEDQATGHVVLVEFFTNAHYEFAIAGALANEGLLSHFSREHVAILTYHLAAPEPSSLITSLAARTATTRGVRRPILHVIDGTADAPGAGRASKREEVYNECRRAVMTALRTKTRHRIRIEATVRDGVVAGIAEVVGPPATDCLVHVVLAEKGVLMPGKSRVVIHRMVARAALVDIDGVDFAPTDGTMAVPFSRKLAGVTEANEAHVDTIEFRAGTPITRMSSDIDPEQVVIVAYLRHRSSGRILQAAQVDARVVVTGTGDGGEKK